MRWIGSCCGAAVARDEADDMVQETWLVAVRQMRRFNPQQGRFLAWLRHRGEHPPEPFATPVAASEGIAKWSRRADGCN